MKNKDKIIIKISKSVIVVFGVLTVFNVIMLINKKSYALFQKTVKTDTIIHIQTANEFPSDNKGFDDLKKDTAGGIKGVDPKTGTICENGEECPEYRYVGANVNNYVYFNCTSGQAQSTDTCEMWRIVGIFKDESNVEHLKIVKNEGLKYNIFPDTYKINSITYKIKYSTSNEAYWNYIKHDETDKNDWATAGLQHWLNTESDSNNNSGYLSMLKDNAKEMIANTKYYLGNSRVTDTAKTAYQHERAVSGCTSNKGPTKNSSQSAVEENTDCQVWAGNSATWTGKIALLYPSDYGFSAESKYWDTSLGVNSFETPSSTSWLQTSVKRQMYEWTLSPSSCDEQGVSDYYLYGFASASTCYGNLAVRPALYLVSEINIVDGDGTEGNPYQLG